MLYGVSRPFFVLLVGEGGKKSSSLRLLPSSLIGRNLGQQLISPRVPYPGGVDLSANHTQHRSRVRPEWPALKSGELFKGGR